MFRDILYSPEYNNRETFFGPRFESLLANKTFDMADEDYCRQKVSDTSIVHFQLVTEEVTMIRKSAKLTFTNALANLGDETTLIS